MGFEMTTTMAPQLVTGGGRPAGNEACLPASRLSERESERPGRVPGQLIAGRFRVIQTLGTGSLGAVYLCVETATAKTVAVKLFRRDLAKDEEFADALRTRRRAPSRSANGTTASFGFTNAVGRPTGICSS